MEDIINRIAKQAKALYKKNKRVADFIFRVLIIYIGWKLLFFVLGEESTPLNERLWPWLSAGWEAFNDFIRLILLNVTQAWFDWRGMETEIINNYRLWVHDYAILGVGNYCLAIQLWVFFVALIVSYSGKWYNKLWFSVLGVFLINIINVLRLIIVVYAAHRNPDLVQFNHDYVFNVIVYIFTFLMWVVWVQNFSKS
jgi:exosortase/archaeosortase family protein